MPDEFTEEQRLRIRKGQITVITLPCGTVIKIYPGTDDGKFSPILNTPIGTKITFSSLTTDEEAE